MSEQRELTDEKVEEIKQAFTEPVVYDEDDTTEIILNLIFTIRSLRSRLNEKEMSLMLRMAKDLGVEEAIQNLLAVIHRDGGHKTAELGLIKSCELAQRISVDRLDAESRLASQEKELETMKGQSGSAFEAGWRWGVAGNISWGQGFIKWQDDRLKKGDRT